MTTQGVAETFAKHDFLKGLSKNARTTLAAGAQPFAFEAGDCLGKEGETSTNFYVIQKGHVQMQTYSPDHGAVAMQTVGPGEVVGWSWLIWPYRWRFDCLALDKVEGLAFDAEWLREQCEKDCELGYQIAKRLLGVTASRLAATRVQLLDMFK